MKAMLHGVCHAEIADGIATPDPNLKHLSKLAFLIYFS